MIVAVLAALGTVVLAEAPSLRFAYHAPSLRVALEASAAVIAIVAAYLALGRFVRGRRLNELLLAWALGLLAVANLVLALLLATWLDGQARLATSSLSMVGAALLAAASFAPDRRVRLSPRFLLAALLGTVGLAAIVFGAVRLSIAAFPPDFPGIFERDTSRPQLGSNRGLLAIQVPSMIAFAIAAIGFARRSRVERDHFLAFVSVAVTLAAFARLHYLLVPAIRTDWVYTGDLLRFAFYAVLLAGAAREIGEYWRGLAANAVLEERRRIARDLHDGLAQELAFIGRRARRLEARGASEELRQIVAAADRALGESRRAIAALTRPLDQPLAEILAEAVERVADTHPVELELALDHVEVGAEEREALVRIACEAVSNAARHGGATLVRLELTNGSGVRFTVSDDGVGFDTTALAPGRFGLVSMRERAHALGGTFRVRSTPGRGTEVEVLLP